MHNENNWFIVIVTTKVYVAWILVLIHMMLVSMIKTFSEDHGAGCEGVELAPLQYTTYELQPLGQSQQIDYTYSRWSIRSKFFTILLTTPSSLCSFPNLISSSSDFRTVFNEAVCRTPEAFAFLGIGSLLSPLLLLVAAPKNFVMFDIFHRFWDFLRITRKQGTPGDSKS